jgi:hypothetical protein
MNEKPDPITQTDLERELARMTDADETSTELWREALQRVRREDARGTRRIPGRRRMLGAGALAAAVLVLGVSITMLVTGGLGAPSARHTAMAQREAAAPSAGIATADLADELDGMLLAEVPKRDMLERMSAFAAEAIDEDAAEYGSGRDFSRLEQSDQARESRIRQDDTLLRDQPAPAAFAARAAEPSTKTSDEHAEALADSAAIAETELAPMAAHPMLEKSADLKLETGDVDEALARAVALVDPALGEYVVLSRVSGEGLGRRAAVSLRVSSSRFESVLDRLRQLGEVLQIESTATDLSAQAADLNDRIALAVETERDILDRFETLDDPLASETFEARRQIRGARSEVDQLQSQLRAIESRAAWATVRVLFAAAAPDAQPETEPGFFDRLGSAATEGLSALQAVTIWLTRALIASVPVIAVLGLIAWLLWRRFSRR